MIEGLSDDLRTLVRFGLTVNQAKIYLTMLQSKADTIKAISRLSNIPLESIYRAMPGLEEKNIVEKMLTVPIKYKALPINEAIVLLKSRYEHDRLELYEEAETLSKRFSAKKSAIMPIEQDSDTSLIIGSQAFANKLDKALDEAEHSFKGIMHSVGFRRGMFKAGKHFEVLVRRGVKCRHLVYQLDGSKLLELGDNHLINNPLWVRKFTPSIPIELVIVDQKQVLINLTLQENGKDYRGLRTTNPCLLALANNYFELLWKYTKETEPLIH